MQDDTHTLSDDEIIHQVIDGNVNAFESLLIRHREAVLRIVKKHVPYSDVEATAQDVFVRAYLSLATFKGKSDFRRWVSSIAVRTCYDFWRKVYRSREVPMSELTEKHQQWLEAVMSEQAEESRNAKGSQKEAREVLDWALGKLSAADRTVLELVYLEGLSGKDAADLLGWSIANVKVRSFRSRNKLKSVLTKMIAR